MTRLEAAAARLVASWTHLYTAGLPASVRDRRREEIGADLHGQLEDARSRRERPAITAAVMISRLVRGGWHDLSWRREVSRPVRLARWQARRGWWIAGVLLITLAAGTVWLSYGLSLRNAHDLARQHPPRAALVPVLALLRPGPPGRPPRPQLHD